MATQSVDTYPDNISAAYTTLPELALGTYTAGYLNQIDGGDVDVFRITESVPFRLRLESARSTDAITQETSRFTPMVDIFAANNLAAPLQTLTARWFTDTGITATLRTDFDITDYVVAVRPLEPGDGISSGFGPYALMVYGEFDPIPEAPPEEDPCITGTTGDDLFRATAEADCFIALEGIDTISYAGSNRGVTVNFESGVVKRGWAKNDFLAGMENITGSRHADKLTGDASVNRLKGGKGDDQLTGGAGDTLFGGADNDRLIFKDRLSNVLDEAEIMIMAGGSGTDTADFSKFDTYLVFSMSPSGAVVDTFLDDPVAVLKDIEFFIGSEGGNLIYGPYEDVKIRTGAGKDQFRLQEDGNKIFAGGGRDTFKFYGVDATVHGDAGRDVFRFFRASKDGDLVKIQDFTIDYNKKGKYVGDTLVLSKDRLKVDGEELTVDTLIDAARARGNGTQIELDNLTIRLKDLEYGAFVSGVSSGTDVLELV